MATNSMTDYLVQLTQDEKPALVYIMDPMCSWCWAFKPVLTEIRNTFPELGYYTLAGGLAPDSDEPMPDAQQEQIAATWKKIEAMVGTKFNHDFWRACQPRRSTYPACRALLLARKEGKEDAMISAIQQAYYGDARNPSDSDTLIDCAKKIGMDGNVFELALSSEAIWDEFENELAFNHHLGVRSFPTLVLKTTNKWFEIALDYKDASVMINQIRQRLNR